MFNVRWLEENDYPELCEWWKAFRFPRPIQKLLPDNGKGGVMVSKGDINICAGFIYFTNSCGAMIEFVVSNFNYKDKDRAEALKTLFSTLEGIAKDEGYELVFSTVKNQPLINKMVSFGWKSGSISTEMIKAI